MRAGDTGSGFSATGTRSCSLPPERCSSGRLIGAQHSLSGSDQGCSDPFESAEADPNAAVIILETLMAQCPIRA